MDGRLRWTLRTSEDTLHVGIGLFVCEISPKDDSRNRVVLVSVNCWRTIDLETVGVGRLSSSGSADSVGHLTLRNRMSGLRDIADRVLPRVLLRVAVRFLAVAAKPLRKLMFRMARKCRREVYGCRLSDDVS